MARINVDDDWFLDLSKRRSHLIKAVADVPVSHEDMADGMALRAWRLAQHYWKDGRKKIPLDAFMSAGLEPLLKSKLAKIAADGVYVSGSKDRHEWLLIKKKSASKGGKNSGKSRKVKSRNEKSKQNEANASKTKQAEANASNANPLALSLSLAEETFAGAVAPATPTEIQLREPVGSDVWQAYRESYFSRYRVEPVRNAKANTMCKRLVESLGGDGAVSVVKFYLTHNKQWYVSNVHQLEYCVKDCEALHTQWMANHRVTTTGAMQADKGQANATNFQAVHDKLLKELEANGTI